MVDLDLPSLPAVPQSDVDDNLLLYCVDVTPNTSNKVTKGNLFAGTKTTQLTLTLPSGPTGSASQFLGGINIPSNTITFATAAQTGDYSTNFIGNATLVDGTGSGTIPNAASIDIVGAPIASTGVTITNNYALRVRAGTTLLQAVTGAGVFTSTGGITMSSADITLAGNKIKTTNYNFYDTTVSNEFGASRNTLLVQQSNTNTDSAFVIASNGSGKSPLIGVSRIGSDLITNYEILQITGDQNVVGEFAINISKGGSGSLRPLNIYMSATKLLSFDTANTITSNVNTIFGVGGNTFVYINGNNNTFYPSSSKGVGAFGWNFQSSAVDFWNTFTSATDSFVFRQLTGVSTQTTLAILNSSATSLLTKLNINTQTNQNGDQLNIIDIFGITPIPNNYTQMEHNLYYSAGWKSRQGGSGVMIELDGGTAANQQIQFLVGNGTTGTAQGAGITMLTVLGLGTSGVNTVNGRSTAGLLGIPAVFASYSQTGKSAAVTNAINYTPPAVAGRYRLGGIVDMNAWTTPASITVVVTYKDDSGNARTETLTVSRGSTGATAAAITAVDRWYFELPILAIDSSATAITVSTAGTFTGSPNYNLSAVLEQLA